MEQYDVIVVGAGHAGCEAAAAAANMGSRTLLITMNMGVIGQMSCNPAMGGVAKGQIVREIDALGGQSGIISDVSMVQFRMLNRSKGPAMWSPRTQNDRELFAKTWRLRLEQTPNVHFRQDMVAEILSHTQNGQTRAIGVRTNTGLEVHGRTVILTNGTFLGGVIHIGEKQFGGGRAGERSAHGITEQLTRMGFQAGRMKTGTPPRVDGRSLDYGQMEEQPGDERPGKFSYLTSSLPPTKQLSCWITRTSEAVHDTLRTGFDRSPMFNGRIRGNGPRYCPSIEDKIDRFADKDSHQIFVEPEGWNTVETYVNGFSTSLPEEVQEAALRQIPGFQHARIFRPGYAVEYDYFPPTQLKHSLETKLVDNLFFAGQINGTTGYEEAAGQGLVAGINAHHTAHGLAPFVLTRDEAYIGVLIDDLITKGTDEPYRMFTSRAEHRILLRQDNADVRLTEKGHAIGLATDERLHELEAKNRGKARLSHVLNTTSITPEQANPVIVPRGTEPMRQGAKLSTLLLRPQLNMDALRLISPDLEEAIQSLGPRHNEITEYTENETKYSGYIQKEHEASAKALRLEHIRIPAQTNFETLHALSFEARQKLSIQRPETIGQASRISGVSPADINVLLTLLGR